MPDLIQLKRDIGYLFTSAWQILDSLGKSLGDLDQNDLKEVKELNKEINKVMDTVEKLRDRMNRYVKEREKQDT